MESIQEEKTTIQKNVGQQYPKGHEGERITRRVSLKQRGMVINKTGGWKALENVLKPTY